MKFAELTPRMLQPSRIEPAAYPVPVRLRWLELAQTCPLVYEKVAEWIAIEA